MGKSKFNWWPFVVNMTRDHPIYTSQVGQAVRLSPQEQREYDTVCKAIEVTREMPDGKTRLDVVELTLWAGTHNTLSAADELGISPYAARQIRWQFVLLVGHLYGFLTEDEYTALSSDIQRSHHFYGVYCKHEFQTEND